MAHKVVCCDNDAVHLATVHVVQCTVSVIGNTGGGGESLVCLPRDCVVISTIAHVPLHLADCQAVLGVDLDWDARL